jgi:hypothetical protein
VKVGKERFFVIEEGYQPGIDIPGWYRPTMQRIMQATTFYNRTTAAEIMKDLDRSKETQR